MNQNNLARKLRKLDSNKREIFLRRVIKKYENYFQGLDKERTRADDALMLLYRMADND